MSIEFGTFSACSSIGYPICQLFVEEQKSGCRVQTYEGTFITDANIANFIASILLTLLSLFFAWRSFRKHAAVGRKEMHVMFSFILVASILQILMSAGFLGQDTTGNTIAAIQVGFAIGAFWTLFLNGIVSFQFIADGSITSMILVFGTSLFVIILTTLFSLDRVVHFNTSEDVESDETWRITVLWILYFLLPIACIVGYLISQITLVLRYLGTRKPLLMLLWASVAFIAAQIFYIFIQKPMCEGTNGAIDAAFAGTLFTGIAIAFVYRYWDSITEDEYDNFNIV